MHDWLARKMAALDTTTTKQKQSFLAKQWRTKVKYLGVLKSLFSLAQGRSRHARLAALDTTTAKQKQLFFSGV